MSDAAEDDLTAVARWAAGRGFVATARELRGETPLLREGLVEVAADAHEGDLGGYRATAFELYIDATGLPVPGDTSISSSQFVALLVAIDAPAWPRLTIHPSDFSEGDWLSRLLRHDDHRIRHVDPDFDRRYRLRVADSTSQAAVERACSPELVGWVMAQPTVILDVENNVDTGDSLLVAAKGGARAAVLDRLADQAVWLARFFEAPVGG